MALRLDEDRPAGAQATEGIAGDRPATATNSAGTALLRSGLPARGAPELSAFCSAREPLPIERPGAGGNRCSSGYCSSTVFSRDTTHRMVLSEQTR